MTYKRLVDQAEAIINIVHKRYLSGNKMAYPALLFGIDGFYIESYPGAGHNYQAVIDAIHNCYAKNTTSGIDIGYKEGLKTMVPCRKRYTKIVTISKEKRTRRNGTVLCREGRNIKWIEKFTNKNLWKQIL